MRKLLLIILSVLLSVSCSTLRTERPAWVDNPPSSLLSTVIVGSGEGESEEEADRNAYISILSSLSEKAGVDYTEKYYEELSSTDMISSFDTVITMKYRTQEEEVHYSYMLSTTDTLLLEETAAADYSVLSEREERVKSKVDESLSYYRDNKDVKAINALLEAIEITLEGEIVNADYSTDVLISRLEKYTSQIEFEFLDRKEKKTEGEIGFRIYRNKGIMHPSVENADVIVMYPSLSARGEVVTLPYDAESDEDGIVIVNRTNAYSLKKGTMSITIAVDEDVIKRIDQKGGEELLSSFRSLLSSKVFSSEYSDSETYAPGEAVIALALYGYDGGRKDIEHARDVISEMCRALGISNFEIVEAEGEDEEEALSFLNEAYSSRSIVYMVRIGIVDRVYTLGTWYTKTEGKIIKIDNTKGTKEEYKTMQYSTSNDGESPDDTAALDNQIRLTCSFVLGEF